jgi:hypothetical protein
MTDPVVLYEGPAEECLFLVSLLRASGIGAEHPHSWGNVYGGMVTPSVVLVDRSQLGAASPLVKDFNQRGKKTERS